MPRARILMAAYDHIIIGGGMSGLTTALLLARDGGKTALVEAFPLLAPTIRGFKRQKVHFETGIHLLGGLGHNHPLDIYFRHLGIAEDLIKVPFEENGYDTFRFAGNSLQVAMPFGYDKLQKTLSEAFPEEQKAISVYLSKIKYFFDKSPFLNFNRDFSLETAAHADSTTLQEFLDSITDNKNLKDLLSYHTLLYGTAPEFAAFSTHALVAGSYFLSSHSIANGGLAVVKAFQKQLKKHGVDIFCGSKVTKISHSDKKEFKGVTLADGRKLTGRNCVWTAHPAALLDCVGEGVFRPVFKHRLKNLHETTSALILFGIARKPVPELTRKNLYLWPDGDYTEMLAGNARMERNAIFLSAGQDQYKNKPQPITAIMPYSPDEFRKWSDSNLNNRPQDYKDFKSFLMKKFEAECFGRCPELRGKVEFIDFATPLTLRDYCSSPYGSIYGVSHTAEQYNPLPVTKMKRLYLAGQGIIAPGILGAVVSAYLASGIICGHDKIHKELRCIYNG